MTYIHNPSKLGGYDRNQVDLKNANDIYGRNNLYALYMSLGVHTDKITIVEYPCVIWSTTRHCLVGSKDQPPAMEIIPIEDGDDLRLTCENNRILSCQIHPTVDVNKVNMSDYGIVVMATEAPYFRYAYIPSDNEIAKDKQIIKNRTLGLKLKNNAIIQNTELELEDIEIGKVFIARGPNGEYEVFMRIIHLTGFANDVNAVILSNGCVPMHQFENWTIEKILPEGTEFVI